MSAKCGYHKYLLFFIQMGKGIMVMVLLTFPVKWTETLPTIIWTMTGLVTKTDLKLSILYKVDMSILQVWNVFKMFVYT